MSTGNENTWPGHGNAFSFSFLYTKRKAIKLIAILICRNFFWLTWFMTTFINEILLLLVFSHRVPTTKQTDSKLKINYIFIGEFLKRHANFKYLMGFQKFMPLLVVWCYFVGIGCWHSITKSVKSDFIGLLLFFFEHVYVRMCLCLSACQKRLSFLLFVVSGARWNSRYNSHHIKINTIDELLFDMAFILNAIKIYSFLMAKVD